MSKPKEEELARAFNLALEWLVDQVKNHGWKKISSNYLREHVRCRWGYSFTNSRSPDVLDELRRTHPELKDMIVVRGRKKK